MEGIRSRPILAPGPVVATPAVGASAPIAEVDPLDLVQIALGEADAATVTADEAWVAGSYGGELGEALDEMTTDDGERDDAAHTRLLSLEEQAQGWIIAGWPIDVDGEEAPPPPPSPPPEVESAEEMREEIPSFMEWLSDWS
jgi:hypothetical protein